MGLEHFPGPLFFEVTEGRRCRFVVPTPGGVFELVIPEGLDEERWAELVMKIRATMRARWPDLWPGTGDD